MKFTRLLLIAILTFFITCGQESAEDVALNAIKALISGNAKKLSEYFVLDEVTQGEQNAIKSKLNEISQEFQEKIAKNGGFAILRICFRKGIFILKFEGFTGFNNTFCICSQFCKA